MEGSFVSAISDASTTTKPIAAKKSSTNIAISFIAVTPLLRRIATNYSSLPTFSPHAI
jgi:hypothetical protein